MPDDRPYQDSALGLRADDLSEVVLADDKVITRAQLRAQADELCATLATHKISRALVLSDDPTDIIRAIDACDRASVDLYIAHTNLGKRVDELVRLFGIQFKIGAADEPLAAVDAAPCTSPRIYMMTSGTTGMPKVAMHSLASLLSRVENNRQRHAGGRWLLTYQSTGFAGLQVILTAVLSGGTLVVPSARVPAAFLDAALRHEVQQISGTPTFWRAFLMAAPPAELAKLKLRQITLGGEAADQATLDRLTQTFPNTRVTHTYASTEAGIVYAVHDGRAGFPAEWLENPVRGVELRIRDGFLHIKTKNRMEGYVDTSNQPILADGWLATLDRAEVRGDRAYILGREDSTINVAGSKVYPAVVENVMLTLPTVREARVYGIANPISGFLVAADVVLTNGEDPAAARKAILEMCRLHLASYQVPRILKFVESISVSPSGKKATA